MSLVLAIGGRKGGVGKTSTAVALASIAAKHGKSVLIIDVDSQCNVAASLSVDVDAKGIVQLLAGEDVEPSVCPHEPLIRVLAGSTGFNDALAESINEDALAVVAKTFPADLTIIDCPPGREAVDRLAFAAADIVLAVAEPTPHAVTGAARVLAELPTKKRAAVIIQKLDGRLSLHRNVRQSATMLFAGRTTFEVSTDTLLVAAMALGVPYCQHISKNKKTAPRALAGLEAIYAWIMKKA